MSKTILLYYSLFLAIFISASGIVASKSSNDLLFQLVFFPVTLYLLFTATANIRQKKQSDHPFLSSKKASIVALLFFFLLGVGVFQILTNSKSVISPLSQKATLPAITIAPQKQASKEAKVTTYLVIKPDEQNAKVNIRKEPDAKAAILVKANYGDRFQLSQQLDGWYKIVLEDGSFGFVNNELAITESAK